MGEARQTWPTPFPHGLLLAYGALSATLVANWHMWVSRRVATYTLLEPGHINVTCSVDFRLPQVLGELDAVRQALTESSLYAKDQVFLPLTLLSNGIGPWGFSAIDENGTRLPLLDAEGNRRIAQAALFNAVAVVADDVDVAEEIALMTVSCAGLLPSESGKRWWLAGLSARHSGLAGNVLASPSEGDLYRRLGAFRPDTEPLPTWRSMSTAERDRWRAVFENRELLRLLGRYSQALPMHVAVDLRPGWRHIVKLTWNGNVSGGLHRSGWAHKLHQLVSLDARDLDNRVELPIPMLGGTESQHVQVILGEDVGVRTADIGLVGDPDTPSIDSAGFTQNRPNANTLHLSRRWDTDHGGRDQAAFFGQGQMLATCTTARSALLVSYAVTAMFVSLSAVVSAAIMFGLVGSVPSADNADPITTALTFGGGLFGILVPQIGASPTARAILARTRHRLAAGSASLILIALLIASWSFTGADSPSVFIKVVIGACAFTTVLSCIPPIRLFRRGVKQWQASL